MHDVPVTLLSGFAITQAAVFATSIYLHRGLAHRALRFHPALDLLCRALLWLTTGQDRRQWVGVHRKHHAFTDTPDDPHSPLVHGFWRIQLGNVFYYVREARKPETVERWARDVREDALDRLVFSRGTLGLALGVATAIALLGPLRGLAAAALHLLLYVFVLAPAVNGLGHWWGRRPFPEHSATNLQWLAWLTAGESLHNNHHARPTSARFSLGEGEVDPSWGVIRALSRVRLIELPRVAGGDVRDGAASRSL